MSRALILSREYYRCLSRTESLAPPIEHRPTSPEILVRCPTDGRLVRVYQLHGTAPGG
jgi:hypothetical protein